MRPSLSCQHADSHACCAVYVTANISGGHLNPAVTVATMVTGVPVLNIRSHNRTLTARTGIALVPRTKHQSDAAGVPCAAGHMAYYKGIVYIVAQIVGAIVGTLAAGATPRLPLCCS